MNFVTIATSVIAKRNRIYSGVRAWKSAIIPRETKKTAAKMIRRYSAPSFGLLLWCKIDTLKRNTGNKSPDNR